MGVTEMGRKSDNVEGLEILGTGDIPVVSLKVTTVGEFLLTNVTCEPSTFIV